MLKLVALLGIHTVLSPINNFVFFVKTIKIHHSNDYYYFIIIIYYYSKVYSNLIVDEMSNSF